MIKASQTNRLINHSQINPKQTFSQNQSSLNIKHRPDYSGRCSFAKRGKSRV